MAEQMNQRPGGGGRTQGALDCEVVVGQELAVCGWFVRSINWQRCEEYGQGRPPAPVRFNGGEEGGKGSDNNNEYFFFNGGAPPRTTLESRPRYGGARWTGDRPVTAPERDRGGWVGMPRKPRALLPLQSSKPAHHRPAPDRVSPMDDPCRAHASCITPYCSHVSTPYMCTISTHIIII